MTGTDAFDAMEQLKRALTSSDPTPSDYLSVVRPGDEFSYGSVAPVLRVGMVEDRSGLIVPASVARPVGPFDRARVYVTPEELFGMKLSVAGIAEQLRSVPLEHAVIWAATLLGALYRPGSTQREVEARFMSCHFAEELRTRAVNILREPHRALLVPQSLFVLIKLAFTVCTAEHRPDDEVSAAPLVTALLNIPGHLNADKDDLEDEDLVITGEPGELACYFIANQMFNSGKDVKTAWAAFQRCWRQLPAELAGEPQIVDLLAAYKDATGVPLDDLVTVCGCLWASCAGGTSTVKLEYFDAFGWSEERLEKVLALIAADATQMRQMLAQDVEPYGVEWSTNTFEWYAVVRWPDRVTVLDPDLLIRRATGMWPLYDIKRLLAARGDHRAANQAHRCVDHVYERFAMESLAGIAGPSRLYTEAQLRSAYGKRGKVADAAVDYGHAWVVADITTTGFNRKTAAGTSPESVAHDLDDVIAKAHQVEATIDNLRRDEQKLTGTASFPGRRTFYPVVVVATRFATSPITMTMLRERLEEAGVLQAADVAPLEVMEFEDLHAVEAASERDGLDMLTLLAEKSTASMALMSMRDFLLEKLGRNAAHPARVEQLWAGWMELAIEGVRDVA